MKKKTQILFINFVLTLMCYYRNAYRK